MFLEPVRVAGLPTLFAFNPLPVRIVHGRAVAVVIHVYLSVCLVFARLAIMVSWLAIQSALVQLLDNWWFNNISVYNDVASVVSTFSICACYIFVLVMTFFTVVRVLCENC